MRALRPMTEKEREFAEQHHDTDVAIRLKPIDGDGKIITRKPKKSYNGDWCFSIDNAYTNTFYKSKSSKGD